MTILTISAACLIDPQGRLLLVRKRNTRFFMLPGGKQEPDEDALTALRRELNEELELDLEPAALTPLGQFRAPAANEANTWVEAQVFIATLNQPVAACAELEALAWWHVQQPFDAPTAPLVEAHVLPALLTRR